jgi:tetratricopeptide (TPR) repeat protein
VGGGDPRFLEALVTTIRRLAALAVIAAGIYAFYLFCYLPYHCNAVKKTYAASTQYAFQRLGTPEGSIAARRNIAALQQCLTPTCRDVYLDMLVAANYRVIGRYQDAVALYRDALRFDRRPEIYLNLAATEMALGDRDLAREEMVRAALFNPWMISSIEDGQLRQEVVRDVISRRPENADFIHYIDALPPLP